jgi:transposase
LDKIAGLKPKNIVYIDETGFDEYYSRNYGYSKRGQRIIGKVYGRKIFRTNLVAGLVNGKIIAEKLYKENAECLFFEDWFANELLPQVKKKSIIVLDNATFHRKAVLLELAKKRKCHILFLPPYSPDLNPIEKKWSNTKRFLKDNVHKFNTLQEAILNYLKTV